MKKFNYFHRSPEGDGGGGGGEITFTPEQETVVAQRVADALEQNKPEITLKSATDFLKNANIKVFSSEGDYHQDIVNTLTNISGSRIENPTSLERSVLKFKSSIAGEVLSPVDQEVKSLTGKDKQEGEKTRDYIKRVLPEVMKGGEIDLAEFNSTKSKLAEYKNKVGTLETQYNELQGQIVSNEMNALINKGMPNNLDYSQSEMKMMLPGIHARINERYDIQKDERGFAVIDKETKEAVLDGSGNRKSIDVVVNDYVKAMTDLRFKQQDGSNGSGAGLPGEGGSGAANPNAEQVQQLEKQWAEKLAENGLIGHEKKAFEMRKQMGLPLTAQALEKWPDLKS